MSLNLNDFIMANEMPVRLGFFFGIFAVMALWEMVRPRRHLRTSKAALLLTEEGFADVHIVHGGMTKWIEAGLPVLR